MDAPTVLSIRALLRQLIPRCHHAHREGSVGLKLLSAAEAAEVIVVNENPAVYEGGKVSPHFPYTHGRPIVEQILANPDLIPSFRYALGDQHFVVLRRPSVTRVTNDPACADVR